MWKYTKKLNEIVNQVTLNFDSPAQHNDIRQNKSHHRNRQGEVIYENKIELNKDSVPNELVNQAG